MAKVTFIERRRRGIVGWIFKLAFIAFNLLMVLWLWMFWNNISAVPHLNEAGRAGVAIGATFGTGFILFFWMCGAVILGMLTYFTRGPRITSEL
jgi:NADH:ubiquinone oxidoreductase subunit 6 (subunit J)